jgi:uncharacterized protein (TIGR02246 family)
MNATELDDFGGRYAAAWCSQQADSVAAFFAEDGSLVINGAAPAVGRAAIAAAAQEFMTAFPDLVVRMDGVEQTGTAVLFRWTLTGTHTGPGGTGRRVAISGVEEWRFEKGLVAASIGQFDAADYERQLRGGAAPPR